MSHAGAANVFPGRAKSAKVARNLRRSASEVYKPPPQQHPVYTRIPSDVPLVASTCFEAMVRILLNPPASMLVVDVVSVDLLQASVENWALGRESWVAPIGIEAQ